MAENIFKTGLSGRKVHFVGAKGTGMTALAELFSSQGANLSGSDVQDTFYTDALLAELGMDLRIGFSEHHIPEDTGLIVFSDAYRKDSNPEIQGALKRGIPTMSYAEALGLYSSLSDSSSVIGVHGKTTTTAMVGTILKDLAIEATTLVGSAVSNFGYHCTMRQGSRFFVAECDEYKGHFFHFHPNRILLTSVESDHQDCYPTYESIRDAFVRFIISLPREGLVIYCADDPGAVETVRLAAESRKDLRFIPYGHGAQGPWRIASLRSGEGVSLWNIEGLGQEFRLHMPGEHLVEDATGALALVAAIAEDDGLGLSEWVPKARNSLASFRGSRRRSELLGEARGILFLDDYAHHPTAVRKTLEGYAAFWPGRRLVVDFMSHTYSRTIALLDEFAKSFGAADSIVLHGIYASARETPVDGFSGRTLYERVKENRPDLAEVVGDRAGKDFILYTESPAEAAEPLLRLLKKGDIFVTMGAGDNWKLGKFLMEGILC
jgi:UDP-N-acetylmuramate--alanine ligase